jgi:phenylacetate-CoA ligase
MDHSPCACGRTHVRFKVLGRASDQILVDGRSILPREIMGLVELHHETRAGLFQIIRTDRQMNALRLRVGYDPSRLVGSDAQLAGRLRDDLAARIEVSIEIELVMEQELLKLGPPHKIPRVTSR